MVNSSPDFKGKLSTKCQADKRKTCSQSDASTFVDGVLQGIMETMCLRDSLPKKDPKPVAEPVTAPVGKPAAKPEPKPVAKQGCKGEKRKKEPEVAAVQEPSGPVTPPRMGGNFIPPERKRRRKFISRLLVKPVKLGNELTGN